MKEDLTNELTARNEYSVIGVMSGTSLDGLDLALVHFTRKSVSDPWSFDLRQTETLTYPEALQTQLKEAISFSEESLNSLNDELGTYIGGAIANFLQGRELQADLIASHGHTIFHQPKKGITLQIGSGQRIFESTGIPVVSNFRQADVKAGGQGAPLVPIGDRDLFGKYELALNLGGIANISFEKNDQRLAFDICPFNMALNELANQKGLNYDAGGELARRGKVDVNLLKALNDVGYIHKPAPKSLGLEDYLQDWQPLLRNSSICLEDKMATYVEHAAIQIADVINDSSGHSVLVTGGGAYHDFFISRLKVFSRANVVLPSQEIIEFKEALVFAYLGLLRLENKANCLASVTGANYDVCGGDIVGL